MGRAETSTGSLLDVCGAALWVACVIFVATLTGCAHAPPTSSPGRDDPTCLASRCDTWTTRDVFAVYPIVQVTPRVPTPGERRQDVEALEPARSRVALAAQLAEGWANTPAPTGKPSKRGQKLARGRSIPVGQVRLVQGPDTPPIVLDAYDIHGRMRIEALIALGRALGHAPPTAVPPRLLAVLYVIARDFDRPIYLISGVRQAADERSPPSGHATGLSVDLYVPGISAEALRAYCAAQFADIGLGYRARARHLHLDVRREALHWTDTARPGQGAVERFEASPGASADPTLDPIQLGPKHLYAARKPPRDSNVVPPEGEAKDSQRRAQRRRRRGRRH